MKTRRELINTLKNRFIDHRRRILLGLFVSALAIAFIVTAFNENATKELRGIDVSHWNKEIAWSSVKEDNVDFVYIKATEGSSFRDPKFVEYVRGAREVGLPIGAYHFARPKAPYSKDQAIAQAEFFTSTIREASDAIDYGDLLPTLDLEVDGGLSPYELSKWSLAFSNTVTAITGKRVLLYTGQNFRSERKNFYGLLDHLPLWVAFYTKDNRKPTAENWTLWQHTDTGTVEGISTATDLNRVSTQTMETLEADLRPSISRYILTYGRDEPFQTDTLPIEGLSDLLVRSMLTSLIP